MGEADISHTISPSTAETVWHKLGTHSFSHRTTSRGAPSHTFCSCFDLCPVPWLLMPRTARTVVPGVAHHVTQRGNRRQQTFFQATDYARYVELVGEGCRAATVDVLAWCLMPNHVHLILLPADQSGLSAALAKPHQRYTWIVNRRNGWQGYLWQSRFYSCPLDDAHLRLAMRYVELNPVRAKLVDRPEDWRWSSARGRIRRVADPLVDGAPPRAVADVDDWSRFLAEGIAQDELERMRSLHRSGKPRGRPARKQTEPGQTLLLGM